MVKWIFWLLAVSLTFAALRLSAGLFTWLVVMYGASTPEAKNIMIGYVLNAAMPVLLAGVPAGLCWSWLLKSAYRNEAIIFLALEVVLMAYIVYGDVQSGVAVLLTQQPVQMK